MHFDNVSQLSKLDMPTFTILLPTTEARYKFPSTLLLVQTVCHSHSEHRAGALEGVQEIPMFYFILLLFDSAGVEPRAHSQLPSFLFTPLLLLLTRGI